MRLSMDVRFGCKNEGMMGIMVIVKGELNFCVLCNEKLRVIKNFCSVSRITL